MSIDLLRKSVSEGDWDLKDYRPLKMELLRCAQEKQNTFKPLSKKDYSGNPIQLIDFFCGAGGTSLGFASINEVVPAFRFLGGCDINKVSAESYAHNYGTPVINRDIIELAEDDDKLRWFLGEIGFDRNMPTILIGCAPCQGFTSHRKNIGMKRMIQETTWSILLRR